MLMYLGFPKAIKINLILRPHFVDHQVGLVVLTKLHCSSVPAEFLALICSKWLGSLHLDLQSSPMLTNVYTTCQYIISPWTNTYPLKFYRENCSEIYREFCLQINK